MEGCYAGTPSRAPGSVGDPVDVEPLAPTGSPTPLRRRLFSAGRHEEGSDVAKDDGHGNGDFSHRSKGLHGFLLGRGEWLTPSPMQSACQLRFPGYHPRAVPKVTGFRTVLSAAGHPDRNVTGLTGRRAPAPHEDLTLPRASAPFRCDSGLSGLTRCNRGWFRFLRARFRPFPRRVARSSTRSAPRALTTYRRGRGRHGPREAYILGTVLAESPSVFVAKGENNATDEVVPGFRFARCRGSELRLRWPDGLHEAWSGT